MPINIPRNKPPITSGGATGGGEQVSSGSFGDKTVSVSSRKDAPEFIPSNDVGRSIQQRKPMPLPRRNVTQASGNTDRSMQQKRPMPLPRRSVTQASGNTDLSTQQKKPMPLPRRNVTQASGNTDRSIQQKKPMPLPRSNVTQANGNTDRSIQQRKPMPLPRRKVTQASENARFLESSASKPAHSPSSQPQAGSTLSYDYVEHEPQIKARPNYDHLSHHSQSSTGAPYNRLRHSLQATESAPTKPQYESFPPAASQDESTPNYDSLNPKSQADRLYTEVTEDQFRGEKISTDAVSEVPAVPPTSREIASQAIDEANQLVDNTVRYIKELEKDIIGMMEHERLHDLSSVNIANLLERVTSQHNLCIDSLAEQFGVQEERLENLIQSKRLTEASAKDVHQNIGIIKAMKDKLSVMRNQLATESKKITADFFKGLDIEMPVQSEVLTELSAVRGKIGELQQSIDKVTKRMEQLKADIRNMTEANLSAKDIGNAIHPLVNEYKTTSNELLVELNRCDQSLSSVQKDFKNFLGSMSATESAYTKALHSQQASLASVCRHDIEGVLGEIGEIEALYSE